MPFVHDGGADVPTAAGAFITKDAMPYRLPDTVDKLGADSDWNTLPPMAGNSY
jgi:hypothetical protein